MKIEFFSFRLKCLLFLAALALSLTAPSVSLPSDDFTPSEGREGSYCFKKMIPADGSYQAIEVCPYFNEDYVTYERDSCFTEGPTEEGLAEESPAIPAFTYCKLHNSPVWGVFPSSDHFANYIFADYIDFDSKNNDELILQRSGESPPRVDELLDSLKKDMLTKCVLSDEADGVQWLASLAASKHNSPAFNCFQHPATPWMLPYASRDNPMTFCRYGFWPGAHPVVIDNVRGCHNLWYPDGFEKKPLFMPWKKSDFPSFIAKFYNVAEPNICISDPDTGACVQGESQSDGSANLCPADPSTGLCIEELCKTDEKGNCISDLRWSTPHQVGECKSLNTEFSGTYNYETDLTHVFPIGSPYDTYRFTLSKGSPTQEYYDSIGEDCHHLVIDKQFDISGITGVKCPVGVEEGDWRLDKIMLGDGERYMNDGGNTSLVWDQGGDPHFVLRSECLDYTKSPLLAEYYGLTD